MKPLLCLDLEGTLISNAISQIPRPGLYAFLDEVSRFFDLMIYTSVSKERVTAIQHILVEEEAVPQWFKELHVVRPTGNVKPKAACGRSDALLLDDQPGVIAPGEQSWWLPVPEFLPPYPDDDDALSDVLRRIRELT